MLRVETTRALAFDIKFKILIGLNSPQAQPALRWVLIVTRCSIIYYEYIKGSPLFSVELELRQAKLASGEVKHGDEMRGGTVAARFAFGRAENAV